MMTAISNTLNSQPRIDPSTILSGASSDLFAEEEEEIENSVMLEVGLELLLKEPVFKKVKREYSFSRLILVTQEDRKIIKKGGQEAVKFFLELLNKIETAEKEHFAERKDDLLKTPTKFFL